MYKVGDKVRIKDDLVIGEFYDGCKLVAQECMLGEETKIIAVNPYNIANRYELDIDGGTWRWSSEMFDEIIEPKEKNKGITIVQENNKVIAKLFNELGLITKKSIARCHPDDEFDFSVGAKLALDRLLEKPKYKYTFNKFKAIDKYGVDLYKKEYEKIDFMHGKEVVVDNDMADNYIQDEDCTDKELINEE